MGRGQPQTFQGYNADQAHQRMAGLASWQTFSARWRARQGLPLLSPLHVQYLTPQDFCSGTGRPLPPAEQRRLFRHYICLALGQPSPLVGSAHRDAGAEEPPTPWAQEALWDETHEGAMLSAED
jgi:hypothetical protein